MLYECIILTLLFLASFTSYAETCPSPLAIQHDALYGWRILDSDNAMPLPPAKLEQFKQAVSSLRLVEWMKDAPEGEGHCYYEGKELAATKKLADLGVFLAKASLLPDLTNSHWQRMSQGVMHCQPQDKPCLFLPVAR